MPVSETKSRLDPIDILLVDDRPDNLMTLEAVLSSSAYNLIKANSGEEALKYLLHNDCAIILMDVQMPHMDGFETASVIKQSKRSCDIPIIFITAINKDERYVNRGYQTGAVDYIFKPFDPEILKSKVSVFADLHRSKLEIRHQAEQLRENDRKERERALAQLELKSLRRETAIQQKYRDLVEGIDHAVIWSADPATLSFSFVSPSAERIVGYPEKQWLTEMNFWINHVHPEDKDRVLAAFHQVLLDEKDFSIDHRFIRNDGSVVWFHTAIKVTQKARGMGSELQGLSVDLTKTKLAEDALRHSEERSRFLAEAGLLLSRSLDSETTLNELGTLLVPRMADWYSIEVITVTDELRLISAGHADPNKTELTRKLRQQYPSRKDIDYGFWNVLRTGKSEIYADTNDELLNKTAINPEHFQLAKKIGLESSLLVPLMARGKVLGVMALNYGDSHRRYTEADLSTAEDLALRVASAIDNANLYRESQEAIRARDEFLSIASHELKTPLTPLKIQTQTIMRTLKSGAFATLSPEKIDRMIRSSDRQIERLSTLIEELLDISRINIGRLGLHKETFDLSELVRDIADRFCDQINLARCPITLEANDIVNGTWDRFRIEQVIINLLTNAMKYGPGKPIKICVMTAADKAYLKVSDEGIGIESKDQDRIFERFERAVSPSHFGGLGLGLYIVKEIVTAHSGNIRVESKFGVGSTFTVELPLHESVDAKTEPSATYQQSPSAVRLA